MKRAQSPNNRDTPQQVRCAIYTRKSTEEGLDQAFNTLDCQRESCEAYIASQRHLGWTCLEERFDDGGFSGGNTDRPALQRLIADVKAGKIGAVVCYKLDRLSRSLLDFVKLNEIFDQHNVRIVAITQQIDTGTSMGRLMLNVLMSFAQFEREIIAERTRDKIRAARRKGQWGGGYWILGYDVTKDTKLVINESEAEQVRHIFKSYIKHESLLPVLQDVQRRRWLNKKWTTRRKAQFGGYPFSKSSLHRLLTNCVYVGRIKYLHETHPGEHEAIIDSSTWARVQTLLRRNGVAGGNPRARSGALLRGLIRCKACDCRMVPAFTTKRNSRYEYYVCSCAQKTGWANCPSKSVPAAAIEKVVIDQIKGIGQNPSLITETIAHVRRHDEQQLAEIDSEGKGIRRDLGHWHKDVEQLVANNNLDKDKRLARLADLQERISTAERRLAELNDASKRLESKELDENAVTKALAEFTPVWTALTPREQSQLLHSLIETITYDGVAKSIALTFQPAGLRGLAGTKQRSTREIA